MFKNIIRTFFSVKKSNVQNSKGSFDKIGNNMQLTTKELFDTNFSEEKYRKWVGSIFSIIRMLFSITKTDIAHSLGISRSTLTRFENGFMVQRWDHIERQYGNLIESRIRRHSKYTETHFEVLPGLQKIIKEMKTIVADVLQSMENPIYKNAELAQNMDEEEFRNSELSELINKVVHEYDLLYEFLCTLYLFDRIIQIALIKVRLCVNDLSITDILEEEDINRISQERSKWLQEHERVSFSYCLAFVAV